MNTFEQIWRLVEQIPEGRVATYGDIAKVVGTTPRVVGFSMASAPSGLPWHRVVNSRGEISERSAGDGAARQRRRLRAEGIRIDRRGRLDLETLAWLPRER